MQRQQTKSQKNAGFKLDTFYFYPNIDAILKLSDIDDCAADPCQNGAICKDGFKNFTCACAAGYTGFTCGTSEECFDLFIYYLWISIYFCYCHGYCRTLMKVVHDTRN